jgi:hypothetical protein
MGHLTATPLGQRTRPRLLRYTVRADPRDPTDTSHVSNIISKRPLHSAPYRPFFRLNPRLAQVGLVRGPRLEMVRLARSLEHDVRRGGLAVHRRPLQRLVHEHRDRLQEHVRHPPAEHAGAGGSGDGAGHSHPRHLVEGQGDGRGERRRLAQFPTEGRHHCGPPHRLRVLHEAPGERGAPPPRLSRRLGLDRAAALGLRHSRLPPGDGPLLSEAVVRVPGGCPSPSPALSDSQCLVSFETAPQ